MLGLAKDWIYSPGFVIELVHDADQITSLQF